MAHLTPIRMPPSAYFYRQCMISPDPDESLTARMVEHIGGDYFHLGVRLPAHRRLVRRGEGVA
jgi:hypothetical protein